jgi:hypothetical protein
MRATSPSQTGENHTLIETRFSERHPPAATLESSKLEKLKLYVE